MSFAQFDDIYEICYGMLENDEALMKKERSSSEILDDRKDGLPVGKKRREMVARERVKEKESQLLYK